MELRVLNYFLMVAREENITKAAQLLHVTQPTLSRQLMQLEEELGVQLFRREKYSVTLTEDGMLLRRRAQEITSLSEKMIAEFKNKEEAASGGIFIGCGETRSMSILSDSIKRFREIYPLVQFHIYSATADDIKERLEGTHTKEQRLRMLNRRRSDALDEIHWKEKQLERLDYLRHNIKVSQENT